MKRITDADCRQHSVRAWTLHRGHATDLVQNWAEPLDLVVTDPPYAFGGYSPEHALSATVAVVLRETARHLKIGSWMIVFSAASWRSLAYAVEATRGILEPVRIAAWTKPSSRTKVRTLGWAWATVAVLALRKGPKNRSELKPAETLDHISAEPLIGRRRAELPRSVAEWAVQPYIVPGGVFLDPFAGSGALPVAAARMGMRAHGFEIGEEPCAGTI